MTRRLLDRQKLKRATEDSKRVLERARGAPDLRGGKAPAWPLKSKAGIPQSGERLAGPERGAHEKGRKP